MKNSINIIFTNQLPYGSSASNRILQIAKTLLEGNNSVKILCVRPTEPEENIVNTKIMGNYEGVEYIYTSKTNIWPKKKLLKLFITLKGIFLAIEQLNNEKNIDERNFIISADYTFFINIIFFIYAKFSSQKFIHCIDEYPWCLIKKEKYSDLYKYIYIKIFYKMFDGLIIMTDKLKQYYKDKKRYNAKVFHFPMSVEFERFKHINNSNKTGYIAYCGGDYHDTKDGISMLIQSFSKVSEVYNNLKLYLIGPLKSEKNIKLIDDLQIADKVVFTGNLNREQIPQLLVNAEILVLARPNSLQAEGGFPSKLGEYLASGRPVVVTTVGDIPLYLEDKESAFLVEPGNISKLSEKLIYVLTNPSLAQYVGKKGKEVAKKYFDYKNYSKSLTVYLNSLYE